MISRHIEMLIVEDNPVDRELLKEWAHESAPHLELKFAEDAMTALGQLESYHVKPRAIILDLNLPGIPGIELLRRIKMDDVLKTIPVIVFTSSTSAKDLQLAYSYGTNAYVTKGMGLDDMLQNMNAIKSFWMATNIVT